jgi:bifunctional DNA-binding transcriptional regulator/antitoxin component of YhaV-PrlF toxin-antitoxin module
MRRELTVTSKGQVTLRKELLNHLGVAPGDKISFECLPSGRVAIEAARREGSIDAFFGCLQLAGLPTLTIEAMNDIIADGWSGKEP